MTIGLTALVLVILVILIPVCLVQVLYLAALRLRARETPALTWFKESLEPRLGLKLEEGALTYSMVKHTLVLLMAVTLFALIDTSSGRPMWREVIETFIAAWLLMLGIAHLLPHLLYKKTEGRWLLAALPILIILRMAMRPLVATLIFLESLAELNEPEESPDEGATQADNIEALIEAGAEEGLIEEGDRKLIQSVVEFGDKTVREVMTPRPSVVAVSKDASLEELRRRMVREEYSRVPVYDGSIDHVVGFVHFRDVFRQEYAARAKKDVAEIMRPIRYVPETKPVAKLFAEMQEAGAHIVMVADEYGNTAGLATLEDLVEEILGEIRDEHEPTRDVVADDRGGFIVSGNLDTDRLEDLLGVRPPEHAESTTVGGLVTEWAGRVPEPGAVISGGGLTVEVLSSDERRVSQVRLSRAAADETEHGRLEEEVLDEPTAE
jgi:CBS domain containing-hemolysin-like protein